MPLSKDNIFLLTLMRCPALPGFTKVKPEERESIKLANALRAWTIDGLLDGVWTHPANEGKRSQIVGALTRAMGLIAGTPDYIFMGKDKSLGLELKVGTNKQSPSQLNFENWCESQGVPYYVVRSTEQAEEILKKEGWLHERT